MFPIFKDRNNHLHLQQHPYEKLVLPIGMLRSGGYYPADSATGCGQESVVKPGSRQGMSGNYAGEPGYTFSG